MATDIGSLKVIIIGGSVAGLTLAHYFERTGIDYVLLEGHAQIAPQLGASIALLPNGCLILDQLGLWDEIEKLTVPIMRTKYWVEGKYMGESDSLELVTKRYATPQSAVNDFAYEPSLGYASGFLDRRLVLEVVYDRLPDKSKVVVNKRVVKIEHTETGVIVHCKDGSQFVGDIVAGADGTHSKTRDEIWRRFDSYGASGLIAKDRKGMLLCPKLIILSAPL